MPMDIQEFLTGQALAVRARAQPCRAEGREHAEPEGGKGGAPEGRAAPSAGQEAATRPALCQGQGIPGGLHDTCEILTLLMHKL